MKKALKSNASQTLLSMIWSNRVSHQLPCQLECISSFKYHMQNRSLSPPCLRLLDLFFLDFTSSQMIQKYKVCFNSFLSFSSRAVCCKSRSKVSSRLKKAKFRKAHLTADTSSSWPAVRPSPHKSTLYSIIGTFEMPPFSSKENALQFPDFQHLIKGQQPTHTHTKCWLEK